MANETVSLVSSGMNDDASLEFYQPKKKLVSSFTVSFFLLMLRAEKQFTKI